MRRRISRTRLSVIRVLLAVLGASGALSVTMLAHPLPALAQGPIVINGCTIVEDPTPDHHTECPGTDLNLPPARSHATSGLPSRWNLRFANLSGATISIQHAFPEDSLKPDLSDANLSGADLREAQLSGANLRRANLSGAKLDNKEEGCDFLVFNCAPQMPGIFSDLSRTDLRGANLSGAFAERANLNHADLAIDKESGKHANLTGANLDHADLRGAQLGGANLSPAPNGSATSLSLTNLSQATLSGANLSRAFAENADLAHAKLIGANLRGTDLRGADLLHADLTRADMRGALTNVPASERQFQGAIWSDTTCPDGTNSNNNGGTCTHNLSGS